MELFDVQIEIHVCTNSIVYLAVKHYTNVVIEFLVLPASLVLVQNGSAATSPSACPSNAYQALTVKQ